MGSYHVKDGCRRCGDGTSIIEDHVPGYAIIPGTASLHDLNQEPDVAGLGIL